MPVKCQTVINLIESIAPKRLAEEWDNVGLNIGNPAADITGILVALDVTPQVVKEALDARLNLIVSHHPLIFSPLKNIRQDNPLGELICNIIRHNISVYCAHTNLDSAEDGVNRTLAELLNLQDVEVLNPNKAEKLYKLVVFVPKEHEDTVRDAMTSAGAGWIGNYSDCTFSVDGTGTFKAREGCNPFIGEIGILEKASEARLESIVREREINKVVKAMLKVHPYEEVAYDIYPLANETGALGLGRIGKLAEAVAFTDFMDMVKDALKVSNLRYVGDPDSRIEKVAVCGGSGASLIRKAKLAGADVLLTGDVKYHEAHEAASLGLNIVDAGHFATENPVVAKLAETLRELLAKEGIDIPVHHTQINQDIFRFF